MDQENMAVIISADKFRDFRPIVCLGKLFQFPVSLENVVDPDGRKFVRISTKKGWLQLGYRLVQVTTRN